jgi:uncharacterized RDD family membrane protein YckC
VSTAAPEPAAGDPEIAGPGSAPVSHPAAAEPAPRPKAPSRPTPLFRTEAPAPDPVVIQRLIDAAVARYGPETPGAAAPTIAPALAPGPAARAPQVEEPPPDRLILLSRTLSGLIDLLIVFFWGATFILAAEIFSGIAIFDLRSRIHFALLLVALHFVYSFFFLRSASQTIGMMITELRVVRLEPGRLTARQILARSALFLPSLVLVGGGLLRAFFDPRSRCLHDSLSGTEVVRL